MNPSILPSTTAAFRPIETRYRGYRFRSRTEARWAIFFDALEIRYEYEPEAYDLGFGTLYLPDFLLRRDDTDARWVEVKGVAPTADEKRKLDLLCRQSGRSGFFLVGAPDERSCARVLPYSRSPAAKDYYAARAEHTDAVNCCRECETVPRAQYDWMLSRDAAASLFAHEDVLAGTHYKYALLVDAALAKARAARFDNKGSK